METSQWLLLSISVLVKATDLVCLTTIRQNQNLSYLRLHMTFLLTQENIKAIMTTVSILTKARAMIDLPNLQTLLVLSSPITQAQTGTQYKNLNLLIGFSHLPLAISQHFLMTKILNYLTTSVTKTQALMIKLLPSVFVLKMQMCISDNKPFKKSSKNKFTKTSQMKSNTGS